MAEKGDVYVDQFLFSYKYFLHTDPDVMECESGSRKTLKEQCKELLQLLEFENGIRIRTDEILLKYRIASRNRSGKLSVRIGVHVRRGTYVIN